MLKIKFLIIIKIFLVFAAVLSGCATSHQPANKAQPLSERLSQTTDKNLSVTCSQIKLFIFPLIDDKLAKAYTGISPKKSGMLPTFIKVDNMSQYPVKVDLPNSFVTMGNQQHPHMTVEEAIERARNNYVALSLASAVVFSAIGGVTGGMATIFTGSAIASKNIGVDERYRDISFKPTLINCSSSGSGIVFFDVPKDKMENDHVTISIPLMNLGTIEKTNLEISVQTKDLKTLEEGKK